MKPLVVLICFLAIFQLDVRWRAAANETCCGDLGCFQTGAPFFDLIHRPFSLAPNCNLIRQLTFILNTRQNPEHEQELTPDTPPSIFRSNFNASLPTKILIHGHLDHHNRAWWKAMRDELLREGDYNVIRVDWSAGSTPPYIQSIANARLVGAFVEKFVEFLKSKFRYSAKNIHMIGHSLGAHIAGYAGKRIVQLGRITGLDPTGPFFTGTSTDVHLDITDALVVDTIVTNGKSALHAELLVFGSTQTFGHLNFFPNGGLDQPGCDSSWIGLALHGPSVDTLLFGLLDYTWATAYEAIACSHFRSLVLYQESIDSKRSQLKAFECESYEKFMAGECFTCSGHRCSLMGHHLDTTLAETYSTKQKSFYLFTAEQPDYTVCSYRIKIQLKTDFQAHTGALYVTLFGSRGNSSRTLVSEEPISFQPGAVVQHVFEVKKNLGKVHSALLCWEGVGFHLVPAWIRKRYIRIHGDIEVSSDSGSIFLLKPERGDFVEREDFLATSIED